METVIATVGSILNQIQGLPKDQPVLLVNGRMFTVPQLQAGFVDRFGGECSDIGEFIKVVQDQVEDHKALMEEVAQVLHEEQVEEEAKLKALADKEEALEKELLAVRFAKAQAMGQDKNCTPVQKSQVKQVKHFNVQAMEKSQAKAPATAPAKPLAKETLAEAKAALEGRFQVASDHPLTKRLAEATPSMMARLEGFVQEYKPLGKVSSHTVQSLEDSAHVEAPGAYLEGVRL